VSRVLLVHDTPLVRSALASMVDSEPDIAVETASWRRAAERAKGAGADVCVVDTESAVEAPPELVQELVRLLAQRDTALLVLARAGRPGLLRQAVAARATGFVSNDATPERLLQAIRTTAEGERYVDEALAPDFLRAADIPLTPRELAVLSLLAQGGTVTDVARGLHLTRGTVRNYLASITRKTEARSRVDAIRICRQAGWI
jgi:two-component system, NarL family, response regulator DesR